MLVKARCSKCGGEGKMDIADKTKEEVLEILGQRDTWHCNWGNHMELAGPLSFLEFDWDSIEEGSSLTEEDFFNTLMQKYNEVLTTEELQEKYDVEGFSMGMCIVHTKETRMQKFFEFVHSPKGKRFYVGG